MNIRARRRRLRRRFAAVLLMTLLMASSYAFLTSAHADLTDVEVNPQHGSPGTTVTVSGSACSPGLLVNPSRAGVLVLTLGVSIDVAVPPSGEWSVDFVIPSGALQGPHAIVATCTRDLVSLPYVPLSVTVDPPPAAPTTTIDSGVNETTTTIAVTTTTVPAPTSTAPNIGTTTNPPIAAATGDDGEAGPPGGPPATGPPAPPPSTSASPVTTTSAARPTDAVATTAAAGAAAASDQGVTAARHEPVDRGRSLVFGALSPIGWGWMGILLFALLLAAFLAALFAILWFRWLRHTRAREWWIRWHNQILRIRAHARPRA